MSHEDLYLSVPNVATGIISLVLGSVKMILTKTLTGIVKFVWKLIVRLINYQTMIMLQYASL